MDILRHRLRGGVLDHKPVHRFDMAIREVLRGYSMEGGTNAVDAVVTAITGMASTVATNALNLIAAILPVLAPIVAAVIIATLGFKLVRRFSR